MGDRGADGRHFATYVCKTDARLNVNAREYFLVRCSEGGRYFVHIIHVEAIRRLLGRFNQLQIFFAQLGFGLQGILILSLFRLTGV